MMNIQEAFEILDIPPTRDKKLIKKAYAARSKQFHPEEYPEHWNAIRYAYEAALAYADSQQDGDGENEANRGEERFQQPGASKWEADNPGQQLEVLKREAENWSRQPEILKREAINLLRQPEDETPTAGELAEERQEFRELEQVFGRLEELAEEKRESTREYEEEKLKRALEGLQQLIGKEEKAAEIWEKFFSTQEIAIMARKEFVSAWCSGMLFFVPDEKLYKVMKSCLARIEEEGCVYVENAQKKDWEGEMKWLNKRLDRALAAYHRKEKKGQKNSDLSELVATIYKSVSILFLVAAFGARIFRMAERAADTSAESSNLAGWRIQLLNEEEEEDSYPADWILREFLILLSDEQHTREGKERIEEQINNSILLQKGIYLSNGEKMMPEAEFTLQEVDPELEDPEIGKKYYSFEVRSRDGGDYILYIDTAQLGLEDCEIYYRVGEDEEWRGTFQGGGRGVESTYFALGKYLAIVIEVNMNQSTKAPYQIMLESNPHYKR